MYMYTLLINIVCAIFISYSCVRQIHTLQSSLIINKTGMMNLMVYRQNMVISLEHFINLKKDKQRNYKPPQ